jgi:hypothetical protein
VIRIEALPVSAGQTVLLRIEKVKSSWRQGVWLGTEGSLTVGEAHLSQFIVWADTAPPETEIGVEETDGLLRLYNVWDSGRGPGRSESQSHTSGMLLEETTDGSRRYSCNDIGLNSDFTKLVFSVAIASSPNRP